MAAAAAYSAALPALRRVDRRLLSLTTELLLRSMAMRWRARETKWGRLLMNRTGLHRRVSQMPSRAAGLQQDHCVSVAASAGSSGM